MKYFIFSLALIITLSTGFAGRIALADSVAHSGQRASQYLLTQRDSEGKIGSLSLSGWALMGLAANGQGSSETVAYLARNIGTIETGSATDIERTILAVLAAGQDPHQFADKDLVALLRSKAQDSQIGSTFLVNDDLFGVLALLASNQSINDPLVTGTLQFITNTQRPDGSFGWSRDGEGDSNNTAIAIQAFRLAQAKGYSPTYNQAAAVAYLQSTQNSDGGFGYVPGQASDAASTSWVTSAILALGQQPEQWTKDNQHPYSYLQSLQQADGGVRWQSSTDQADPSITAYAAIAFARKSLPIAILVEPSPNPSPSLDPSPTPTPTPTPTATPSPISSPSPTPSPSVTISPTPTLSPEPTPSPSPTPTPSIVPTPSPSPSSSPTPTASPSATTATPTPSPSVQVATAAKVTYTAITSPEVEQESSEEADIEIQYQDKTPNQPTLLERVQQTFTKQSPSPVSTASTTPSPTPSASPTASPNAAASLSTQAPGGQESLVQGTNQQNNWSQRTIGAAMMLIGGLLLIGGGIYNLIRQRRRHDKSAGSQ